MFLRDGRSNPYCSIMLAVSFALRCCPALLAFGCGSGCCFQEPAADSDTLTGAHVLTLPRSVCWRTSYAELRGESPPPSKWDSESRYPMAGSQWLCLHVRCLWRSSGHARYSQT